MRDKVHTRQAKMNVLAYNDSLKLQDMFRAYSDEVTPIELPGNRVGMYDGKYSTGEELATMYLNGCIATILYIESEKNIGGILTHFTQRQWIGNLEKIETLIDKNVEFEVRSRKSVIITPHDLSIHVENKPLEVSSLANSICKAFSKINYSNEIVPYNMFKRRFGLTVKFRHDKQEWESEAHGMRKL